MSTSLRIAIALLTTVMVGEAQTLPAGLRLWLRADTLTVDSAGVIKRWGSIVGGHVAEAQPGTGLTLGTINSRAAIVFANSAFYKAPSVFPVKRDYTMYVVYNWNGVHSANNMVSGENRAFFTSAPGVPTVLHSGDFARLSVSSLTLSGPTVLRVRHTHATGQTSIAHNNAQASDDIIPQNIDSTVYVGAYRSSNGLNGSIAEVLIFDRTLSGAEQTAVESYLHARYSISRAKDPAAPLVRFINHPRKLEVLPYGSDLEIKGVVMSDSLDSVRIEVHERGSPRAGNLIVKPRRGDTLYHTQQLPRSGLASYDITVSAWLSGVALADTILQARDVAVGIAFSVNGQSNSIFGDASVPTSVWARTFGGNFSQRASDTSFAFSSAAGNGGGPNVGAWALHLQNSLANQEISSVCINGGVGGTRIEQHLPDPTNRLNLSTIYGSWLYRVMKAGLQRRIQYLFWYQGESNSSNDDYIASFDKLRSAWKRDLPLLKRIIVIQIRPGCAGPNHAKLRDDQRRLAELYSDVVVHSASGLPGHDGCHYNGQGYAELGRQMFDLLYDVQFENYRPWAHSPWPILAKNTKEGAVQIDFRSRRSGLMMTSDFVSGGKVRSYADAWFADNDPKLRPTSISVSSLSWSVPNEYASRVTLTFPKKITSVSYVPDYSYDDGAIFQGPWLVTDRGVGAVAFHNFPVSTVSVSGEDLTDHHENQHNEVYDLTGRLIMQGAESLETLPSGPYVIVNSLGQRSVYLVR